VILVIRAATTDSDVWVRRGSELVYKIDIDLPESLLGWERHLPAHPSGRPLHIVWKGGVIQEGETLRVLGWGMPQRSGAGTTLGDLQIICHVKSSQGALSEEQQRALRGVWTSWKEPLVTSDTVTPER
jgi:DnaJ-class molecular chaperone